MVKLAEGQLTWVGLPAVYLKFPYFHRSYSEGQISMNLAKRIVLVQSDQSLIETRKAILELQGYQVQAVQTIEGARVICENLACDLVIVDSEQDYQAAVELCDEIKATHPETNVAVMTWNESTVDSECPDAVIPRDRGPQDFLNRVRTALT